MYCQACGAGNPDDQEFCRRCHHKLLVVSGSRRTKPPPSEQKFCAEADPVVVKMSPEAPGWHAWCT